MAIPALQSHVPKRVPRLRDAPWLNLLVTVALGMLVVHATAQLLSSVGEASELRQSVPPARISGRLTAEASGVTPETLLQLHLFGRASEAGSERKQRITAPETPLDLVLKGIFYSPDPERAIALIGNGSRNVAQYSAGEDLPGGGRVEAIYEDRVILRREGRHETLSLSRERVPTDQGVPDVVPTGSGRVEEIAVAPRGAGLVAGEEGLEGYRPSRTVLTPDEPAEQWRLGD